MDAEEKIRFCTFQASRVAGIGAAVTGMKGIYLAGRTAFTGAYYGGTPLLTGKTIFNSVERSTLKISTTHIGSENLIKISSTT
ncbi:MAG: hypothetical protein KGJ02_08025 [Verrucomicrobiota bacterium]|nr:hypothetical protein [Verrucomicrobiota bacterium]